MVHREGGRLPLRERAQARVDIDEVPPHEPGLVGDPVGLGVEAEARDADVGRAVHVGHVDQALRALDREPAAAPVSSWGRQHAREVVAAPAGDERRARSPAPSAPRPAAATARRRRAPRRSRLLPRRGRPRRSRARCCVVITVRWRRQDGRAPRARPEVPSGPSRRRGRVDQKREAAAELVCGCGASAFGGYGPAGLAAKVGAACRPADPGPLQQLVAHSRSA